MLDTAEGDIDRVVSEAVVLEMYRRHDISARRAATLLGMEFMAFLHWTGEMGIPYIDMTAEEWQKELQTIEELNEIRRSER